MKKEDLKTMKKANQLLKENKIDYDSYEKKLIWIYYPKIFKKLMKVTTDAR